jgi:hypothetical protein
MILFLARVQKKKIDSHREWVSLALVGAILPRGESRVYLENINKQKSIWSLVVKTTLMRLLPLF